MKSIFTFVIVLFFCSCTFAQVGINSASPTTTLDIVANNPTGSSTVTDGILIPRVDRQRAQSMLSIPNATMIYVNSVATGTAAGIATNINSIGFYAFDQTANRWIPFQTGSSGWSTTGNVGTTDATNFLGTTDATNLILKTNSLQRLKIDNSTNTTTGTTGDIEIGDANSGTIRANKEMVVRMDGDGGGGSILRLRNRFAENGAIFETTGGNYLVDFIFKTGPIGGRVQSNIRYEARGGKISGNTSEFQFGQPDSTNGGPTLVVGAIGNGSNSSFRLGNLGIGTVSPNAKLHNIGTTAFTTATSGTNNTVILQNAGTFLTPTAATTTSGLVYIIRNTSATATLTVNNIIDYNSLVAANFALTPTLGSIVIVCDGTNWYRIQ